MKYGARIFGPYKPREDMIWVYQTKQADGKKQYVVDFDPDGNEIHTFVRINDDKAIADAVRDALRGKLKLKRQ